jgi:hypothetical protein
MLDFQSFLKYFYRKSNLPTRGQNETANNFRANFFALFVVAGNAKAQVDEICGETGVNPSLDLPFVHVPFVYGKISLRGFDTSAKWLGLLHTFESESCDKSEPDSEVWDTPAERIETAGCPVRKNTCLRRPGLDPVNNFMDYSIDSCKFKFTALQVERMNIAAQTFRGL